MKPIIAKSNKAPVTKVSPDQKEILKEWEVHFDDKLKSYGYDPALSVGRINDKPFKLAEWMAYYRMGLNRRGLLLHGNTGTGKTFSVEMIKRTLQVKYTEESKLAELYKKNRDSFDEILSSRYINSPNDIIIDELFSENQVVNYGEKTNIAERIVQLRYNIFKEDGSILIATTNCDEKLIIERGGDRALSRLKEMCTFVVVNGEDIRQTL